MDEFALRIPIAADTIARIRQTTAIERFELPDGNRECWANLILPNN